MPAKRSVDEVRPHPYNVEIYGEPDPTLADSLEQFGLLRPIEINSENLILAGARRWRAAKELGWKDIEVEVVDTASETEERKFILLANAYRQAKSLFVRQREADAYKEWLETGEVTEEELAEIAKQHGKEPENHRHFQPAELAPRAAGISSSSYRRAKYITDPTEGEAEIDRYKAEGRISSEQASALKRQLASDRDKFQRDRITASQGFNAAKQRLRDAERKHGYDEDEWNRKVTAEAVNDAVRKGEAFTQALHGLRHKARVEHLTAKDAFRLAGLVAEVGSATRSLISKAELDLSAEANELPPETRKLIGA